MAFAGRGLDRALDIRRAGHRPGIRRQDRIAADSPLSAAPEAGSTAVTTTPVSSPDSPSPARSCGATGARLIPSPGTAGAAAPGSASAIWSSAGSCAVVTATSCFAPSRQIVSEVATPGLVCATFSDSARGVAMASPSTASTTSPTFSPALAAGVSAETSLISAPVVPSSPSDCAICLSRPGYGPPGSPARSCHRPSGRRRSARPSSTGSQSRPRRCRRSG